MTMGFCRARPKLDRCLSGPLISTFGLPLAATLVASQFPEFARATGEPLGLGWDNAAFLVDSRVVFRFPRRRVAAGLIEREIAVLPQIAAHLPLAISTLHFIGIKGSEYPLAFAGYKLIEGFGAAPFSTGHVA
jgi:aminoglycoside phosphotransferase (APT) family kinase protein